MPGEENELKSMGAARYGARKKTEAVMMTEMRSILVHMDASARSLERLRMAQSLASSSPTGEPALVTALYGVVPMVLRHSAVGMVPEAAGAVALLGDLDAGRRHAARQLFDLARGEAGGTEPYWSWAEIGDEALIAGFAAQALCADVLVLGQFETGDPSGAGVPHDFVSAVLLASGKPALVLPHAGEFRQVGQTVLVAWKYSREAARAAASALPLLRRAKQVHVAMSPAGATMTSTKQAGHLDILTWLRAHGVQAQVHHHMVADDDAPGENLLSRARDVGADMLVMGCYGHSRLREWVLGGASRTVLASMTLPVWMAG